MNVQSCSCASRASAEALERLIDLIPHLLADRIGGREPLIISTGIERRSEIEKRLAILQTDVGTGRVDQGRGFGRREVPGEACDRRGLSERAGHDGQDQEGKDAGKDLFPGRSETQDETSNGLP